MDLAGFVCGGSLSAGLFVLACSKLVVVVD